MTEVRHYRNSFYCSFTILLLFLTGCQSPSPTLRHSNGLADPVYTRMALYDQYQEWKGVPYQDGGNSQSGIDCSAFIQRTFQEQFAIGLPRNTSEQAQIGKPVTKRQLQPGDLVFFTIGNKTRHVGVVVEKDKFLHASSSQGVMISDMNLPYWQRYYWQARRLSQ